MKIGIVGGRLFNDYDLLESSVRNIIDVSDIDTIISGGAKGADTIANTFADKFDIKMIECLPDWGKHGRAAGPIRNKEIVKQSDMVIAFWDGESKGTLSSINHTKKMGVECHIIRY